VDSDLIEFPRQTPVDDDGVDPRLVGDELRFLEARNGGRQLDYTFILGRGPVRVSFKDSKIMALIQRASLDAHCGPGSQILWSQIKRSGSYGKIHEPAGSSFGDPSNGAVPAT
jgi:hypothetical protein